MRVVSGLIEHVASSTLSLSLESERASLKDDFHSLGMAATSP